MMADSISPKNDQIKSGVQPLGIWWVRVYSVLVAFGYADFSLELLDHKGAPAVTLGLLLLVLALSFFVVVYGLGQGKLWAYKLARISFSVLLFFELLGLLLKIFDPSTYQFWLHLQTVVVVIGILLYFQKDDVKLWFGCEIDSFSLRDKTLEDSLDPKIRERLQEEVAQEWKKGNRLMYAFFMVAFFVQLTTISSKLNPIYTLDEMEVIEGVLTKLTEGKGKSSAVYLKIRGDDGALFSIRHTSANPYYTTVKLLEGQRIKVWMTNDCMLFGFLCELGANQIEYEGKLVLDYNNDIRLNIEAARKFGSGSDVFFLFFSVVIALIGLLARQKAKLTIKDIRRKTKEDRVRS